MTGLLVVSVSGLRERTLTGSAEFANALGERRVPLSWLVAPRRKHGYRLAEDSATCDWLRTRRIGSGRTPADAVVLHGYDQASTRQRRAEFATISRHEAMLRLTAADRALEQAGLRTRIFAAPRWSASPGAVAALPAVGFRVNAGFGGVEDLRSGTQVRGRVIGIGDGFPDDAWWLRMLMRTAGRTARRGGVVRLHVAAKHLREPLVARTLCDCVDVALHHGLRPATYADRLADLASAPGVGGPEISVTSTPEIDVTVA